MEASVEAVRGSASKVRTLRWLCRSGNLSRTITVHMAQQLIKCVCVQTSDKTRQSRSLSALRCVRVILSEHQSDALSSLCPDIPVISPNWDGSLREQQQTKYMFGVAPIWPNVHPTNFPSLTQYWLQSLPRAISPHRL